MEFSVFEDEDVGGVSKAVMIGAADSGIGTPRDAGQFVPIGFVLTLKMFDELIHAEHDPSLSRNTCH